MHYFNFVVLMVIVVTNAFSYEKEESTEYCFDVLMCCNEPGCGLAFLI